MKVYKIELAQNCIFTTKIRLYFLFQLNEIRLYFFCFIVDSCLSIHTDIKIIIKVKNKLNCHKNILLSNKVIIKKRKKINITYQNNW